MPDYLKTLDDAVKAGVEMIAVCHAVECRHTRKVDLQQVIHHVGAATQLVPIKGNVHFSERMRCPECDSRGMFIWIAVPNQPEPAWGAGKHPHKVLDWGKDGRRVLNREIAVINNLEVARGAFAIACKVYPDHHITLQQGAFVLEDSRLTVVEGGGERRSVTEVEMTAMFTPRIIKS
jgi:hypothetical protein